MNEEMSVKGRIVEGFGRALLKSGSDANALSHEAGAYICLYGSGKKATMQQCSEVN